MSAPKGYEIIEDVPAGYEAVPDGYEAVADAAPKKMDKFTGKPIVPGKNIPIPGISTENTPNLQPQKPYGKALKEGMRSAPPIAAGVIGGMVPGFGAVTGPIAASATDYALSKVYGEEGGEGDLENRGMSLGVDIAAGLVVPGGKQLVRGGRAVIGALKKTPIEQQISSKIREGIEKGIRPTVAGKANFTQTQAYFEKGESAVKSIVENKGALKYTDGSVGLPKTLNHFSEAIDHTKRQIFEKYDYMLKSSEMAGRGVDLGDIGGELKQFAGDRVNQLAGGSGLKYASDRAGEYSGELTLTQAQNLIAKLNQRQKAFLQNPTPDQVSSAAVDAFILNRLRTKVDSAVEKYGYSELKKQYGALRGLEKEVSHRAIVDARKNTKGLLDFSDIYTTAEMAHAMATLNPSTGMFALAMRGMKEYYKRLNNPNKIIENMFKDVDKLSGKVPVKQMKALPPGPITSGVKEPPLKLNVKTGEPIYPTERSIGDVTKGSPTDVIDPTGNYSPMELERYGSRIGPPNPSGLSMVDDAGYYPLDPRGIGHSEPRALTSGSRRGGLATIPREPIPVREIPFGDRALPPGSIPAPGSRNQLFQTYGLRSYNPAYGMSDEEFIMAMSKRAKPKKKK